MCLLKTEESQKELLHPYCLAMTPFQRQSTYPSHLMSHFAKMNLTPHDLGETYRDILYYEIAGLFSVIGTWHTNRWIGAA